MVQGVFLELGSCFLAKMACISPTKSRVKHRTLKKNLTFFRLYQHGLIKERLLIRKSMWCKWVWKHFALKWVSKHLWDVVKKLRICFLSAQSEIPTTFDVGSVREQATKNSEWNQMNPMCVIEKVKHGNYALWQLKYFTNLRNFKVFQEFKLWSRVLWLQWFNIGGAALCGLFIDCENVFDTKIAKSP